MKLHFDAQSRSSFRVLQVRKVLNLLLLVLPRGFLILLHLQLPALLVQGLQLLNLSVRVSYRSWSRRNRFKTGRSVLHAS